MRACQRVECKHRVILKVYMNFIDRTSARSPVVIRFNENPAVFVNWIDYIQVRVFLFKLIVKIKENNFQVRIVISDPDWRVNIRALFHHICDAKTTPESHHTYTHIYQKPNPKVVNPFSLTDLSRVSRASINVNRSKNSGLVIARFDYTHWPHTHNPRETQFKVYNNYNNNNKHKLTTNIIHTRTAWDRFSAIYGIIFIYTSGILLIAISACVNPDVGG